MPGNERQWQTQGVAAERVTIRPRRVRQVGWVLAPIVVGLSALIATSLRGSTGAGTAVFQRSDQIAMICLGLLVAGGILLIGRPKVVADRHGVKIRNIVGGYELPWQVVREIRFDRGSPWLTLELHDDEVVPVMAIQAADKEHAVAGARALRALFAARDYGDSTDDSADVEKRRS